MENDFDSLYGGDSLYGPDSPLYEIYKDVEPWDIGGPQPVIVRLAEQGQFQGRVLDVGCGRGDNALFLAQRGHRVTAFDISPAAIQRADDRARSLGLDVEFVVADAITLKGIEGQYNTVIDSAQYHGLDPEQRRLYITALHRATEPDALLHIACFSDAVPKEMLAPNRCSETDIYETLTGGGWNITDFEPTTYTTSPAFTRELLHQVVDVLNVPNGRAFVDGLSSDELGRLLLPIWLVTAHRA